MTPETPETPQTPQSPRTPQTSQTPQASQTPQTSQAPQAFQTSQTQQATETPQAPRHDPTRSAQDHHEVLGVSPDASIEEIRAAYIRAVKENPPERQPEAFERIRDAYRYLGDPRRRAQERILAGDPLAPLASILEDMPPQRRFVGPEMWLRVIKDPSS